jgi:hypothetical protein
VCRFLSRARRRAETPWWPVRWAAVSYHASLFPRKADIITISLRIAGLGAWNVFSLFGRRNNARLIPEYKRQSSSATTGRSHFTLPTYAKLYMQYQNLQSDRMEIRKYHLIHQSLPNHIRYEPFNFPHIPQNMSITMSNLTINPHFRE